MSRSTPGTLCLRTQSALGTLNLSDGVLKELIQLYLGFLSTLGIQIKSAQRAPGPQTKSTWCAPGHQISTFLLFFNFQFSFFFIFSLKNFSIKMKGLSVLFVLV